MKLSVGKLRPHFLTLCNPQYMSICYDENAYFTIGDSDEQHLNDFFQKYVHEVDVCSLNILKY